jgi:small subunit ribosomal protein S18
MAYNSNPRGGSGQSRGGPGNSGNRPFKRRGFRPRRKVCAFCVDKEKVIDWKRSDDLRRFVNESGFIRSRRKTGTCAKHQRRLAIAIKRSRQMALLPFTQEHVRIMGKH